MASNDFKAFMILLRSLPAIALILLATAAHAADKPVDFTRDIQPILSDKCYMCHGPDAGKRQADLRLDVLDPKLGPFVPRDGYSIIAPGKLDDSVLVMRITSDDPDVHMPPPKSNRTLSDQQIDLLKRWIEQGAKWQKHWSLIPPTRPQLPAVKDEGWTRNAIDRFILARLQKENLKPSPEANRRTLIRRVTLDLIGLPPTREEVDAFVNDPSSDAYEKVVDRLLASPRFGERMAWDWLDVARYADTNGYQNDPTRTMWPWRDWVVRAFNQNLPYDQFVTWQLAGDLLPDSTQDQRLASGFNRNHGYNAEGGRIAEETRVENVMDRVDTTATAFIGLTVGCAKCHDHKYDPISQKEYYQLYAYFNQCSEDGRGRYANLGNVPPVLRVANVQEETKLAALRLAAGAAEALTTAALPAIDAKQREWEETARYAKGWIVATPLSTKSAGGATMQTLGDSSVLVSGKNPDTDVHEIVLKTDLRRANGFRIELLPDPSLPHGGPGRSEDSGNFVLTQIEASAVSTENANESTPIKIANAEATFEQNGFPVANAIDGDAKTGWAALNPPDKSKVSAVFRFMEPAGFARGTEIHLKLHYEALNKQHSMGRFRFALTDGATLTPAAGEALAIDPAHRSDAQKNQLRDFYRAHVSPQYKSLNAGAVAARQAADHFDNQLTKVMVMDDAKPRETHVLVKGAYDKPADKVDAGVLAVLNPLPEATKQNNRLALAKWMFDPANPLTSRVTVNRCWQQFFGVGIVKTVDDFGAQGERPVNPELLDWLAVQFREGNWDTKAMMRLIVTSAAYRQSSIVTPELHERDPENRLLARGPRMRLPSVMIRDQALAVSGLLVDGIGGPPVKPYQPPGIWEEATFGFIKYEQDHGEALYRRSLYTFWRRIVGPTEFFDASSRTVCTVRQSRTNTPLHALTTLNDPTYVESARNLAQRIMLAVDGAPQSRIQLAYRLVLARDPAPREEAVLLKAFNRLKAEYAADKESATKLLSVGESKRNEKLDPTDHAAWTALCLEILNLDEVLTKE